MAVSFIIQPANLTWAGPWWNDHSGKVQTAPGRAGERHQEPLALEEAAGSPVPLLAGAGVCSLAPGTASLLCDGCRCLPAHSVLCRQPPRPVFVLLCFALVFSLGGIVPASKPLMEQRRERGTTNEDRGLPVQPPASDSGANTWAAM